MNQISFGEKMFADIPPIVNASESHMALLFLLDVSGSMAARVPGTNKEAIRELSDAINRFKESVCKDSRTKDILDVALITFADSGNYKVYQEFLPIEYLKPVELELQGTTYICEPLELALDMVSDRSRFYRRSGAEPYKPWVVIMTDGLAMDSDSEISRVAKKVNDMVVAQKVAVWSLISGDGANDPSVAELMHRFCGKRVLKLDGYDFDGFLDWANKSMRAVSQSSPGEKVQGQALPASITIDDLM